MVMPAEVWVVATRFSDCHWQLTLKSIELVLTMSSDSAAKQILLHLDGQREGSYKFIMKDGEPKTAICTNEN
jgi:hypothetical protein